MVHPRLQLTPNRWRGSGGAFETKASYAAKLPGRVQLEVADYKCGPSFRRIAMTEGLVKSFPVVETTGGKVSGYTDEGVHAFKGI